MGSWEKELRKTDYMLKYLKKPVNKRLSVLILIFIISFISILLTDYLICKIVISKSDELKSIGSQALIFLNQKQQIGLAIKIGIGCLGLISFLFVTRQMFTIVSGIEQIQETLKDQNFKIIKKSIELSDVMRQFEDQNYDLELSRKELNEALSIVKEKEKDQRIIFDNSPLGIIRFDDKGEIKECNDKFVELMGSTRERLIGFNTAKQSTPEMQKAIKKALKGEAVTIENRYTSITGGKTLDIRVAFNPVNPGQSTTQVIASIEDITQRKNAEEQLKKSYSELEKIVKEKTSELVKEIEERKSAHEALKKSEEKYRSILENIQDSYFEIDIKGNLIFFNSSLPELLGYSEEELNGLNFREFTEKEEKEKLARVFNTVYTTGRTGQRVHCICITKGNDRKNVEIIISLMKNKEEESIGFRGLARDVTKKIIMERRIQQTQKMEAIGNLAGGIAHDFNNILGGIMGYTQLVKNHTLKESKVHKYVEQIMKASERATGLVKQILLFSRKTESEKIPSEMGLIVKEVIKLLRASIPATVEINYNFKEDLNPILADHTQMHQVLMNLCSNAADAMKGKGGCLDLNLTDVVVNKNNQHDFQELKNGEYIKLSVSDTGVGMDKQTIEQIFDPYFTTKDVGAGTGLGLATVHGIVKDHNGVIRVESNPGAGTVFHLFFPAIKHIIEETHEIVEIVPGTETVLFVDDEIYLAKVGKEMLEDYGYSVESLTSPNQAFELFQKDPERFDLVITDYTMPEMTGEQLVRKIRQTDQNIPIIMCTGISLDPEILNGLKLEKLLMKPLGMNDMLKNIREVLDNK